MKDFIGLEQYIDEDYAKRIDHRFHSKGCAPSPKMPGPGAERDSNILREEMSKKPWNSQVDLCWIVLLYKGGAIDRERASKLVQAIRESWDVRKGVSGEERILEACGGDMDLASTVNYGRTLQEPNSRLKLRDFMIEIADDYLALLETVHKLALENLETIMIGQTHMSHGQPMTYAHFMLSVFDGIYRGLEQFEQAYSYTNKNSGGCGSCSGTTWPIDRVLMAELLGMDGVVEPTFDCEAAQDHTLSVLFALSNTAVLLSRVAMNQYIWTTDEFDMVRTKPSMCGVSSFMPQKCDPGTPYEKVRMYASEVIGEMNKAVIMIKGEPHMDVLPAALLPNWGIEGLLAGCRCLRHFKNMLDSVILNKERMLEIVQEGYSCSTELTKYLIEKEGYGGRLAHSIVATMVRQAREKGLKSTECTGEMLDAAAEYLSQRQPGLNTETIQECFDPACFIHSHNNLGGTAPEENARLLEKRRKTLDEAIERQRQRKQRVEDGLARLEQEADACL